MLPEGEASVVGQSTPYIMLTPHSLPCVQLIFITFAFMAGEYTAYLGVHTDIGAASGCSAADFAGGPVALARWVAEWGACHTFQPAFLTLWGAKCARPPTSSVLHSREKMPQQGVVNLCTLLHGQALLL